MILHLGNFNSIKASFTKTFTSGYIYSVKFNDEKATEISFSNDSGSSLGIITAFISSLFFHDDRYAGFTHRQEK